MKHIHLNVCVETIHRTGGLYLRDKYNLDECLLCQMSPIYIHTHIYIYIYIYIERERERESVRACVCVT